MEIIVNTTDRIMTVHDGNLREDVYLQPHPCRLTRNVVPKYDDTIAYSLEDLALLPSPLTLSVPGPVVTAPVPIISSLLPLTTVMSPLSATVLVSFWSLSVPSVWCCLFVATVTLERPRGARAPPLGTP